MKREIKFRAWGIGEDGKGFMFTWKDFGKSIAEWIGNEERGVKLMQYTGLNDKNGKKIYEGDIVRTTSEGTFVVEWSNVGCDYHGGIGFGMGSESPTPSFYEVIGNIYENPELLKEVLMTD